MIGTENKKLYDVYKEIIGKCKFGQKWLQCAIFDCKWYESWFCQW